MFGFLLLVLALAPVAVETKQGRIGDLSYDAAAWRIEERGGVHRVLSRTADEGDVLWITISRGAPVECNAETMATESEGLVVST